MVPYFKENNFDEGIRQGFNALLVEIYKEYNIDIDSITDLETPVKGNEGLNLPPAIYIIGSIILILIISADFRYNGGIFTLAILRTFFRGGGGGGRGARGGGGSAGGGGSSRRW